MTKEEFQLSTGYSLSNYTLTHISSQHAVNIAVSGTNDDRWMVYDSKTFRSTGIYRTFDKAIAAAKEMLRALDKDDRKHADQKQRTIQQAKDYISTLPDDVVYIEKAP